jgi:hypothetical protein
MFSIFLIRSSRVRRVSPLIGPTLISNFVVAVNADHRDASALNTSNKGSFTERLASKRQAHFEQLWAELLEKISTINQVEC